MARDHPSYWAALETRGPTLLLVAGALILLATAIVAASSVGPVTVPSISYWPIWTAGIGLSLAGAAGLYPHLVEEARWSAAVGRATGLLGAAVVLAGTTVLVVVRPPGPYPASLGVLGVPFIVGLVAVVPTFGLYGLAGLRTATPSRRVGALLLAIAILQAGELAATLFVFPAVGAPRTGQAYLVFEVAVYSAIPLGLLTAGYRVRASVEPADTAQPAGVTA